MRSIDRISADLDAARAALESAIRAWLTLCGETDGRAESLVRAADATSAAASRVGTDMQDIGDEEIVAAYNAMRQAASEAEALAVSVIAQHDQSPSN